MNFEDKHIDELISLRMEARTNKDWKLSDEIRSHLDTKFVFVFDTKDNEGKAFQDVYCLTESYFNLDEVYTYPEVTDKEGNVTPEWSETKRDKIERLHGVKVKTNREYVEHRIKQDILSEKRSEAWLYTVNQSNKLRVGDEYTSAKDITEGTITINNVKYDVIEVTDLYIKAKSSDNFVRHFVRPDND